MILHAGSKYSGEITVALEEKCIDQETDQPSCQAPYEWFEEIPVQLFAMDGNFEEI